MYTKNIKNKKQFQNSPSNRHTSAIRTLAIKAGHLGTCTYTRWNNVTAQSKKTTQLCWRYN